jgi:hypothetical protein
MTLPSIVLIESQQSDNKAIGTGFVIQHTDEHTYLLTCAHVVRDVGGSEQVKAAARSAQVVALGDDSGLDLAVLRIERLVNRSSLNLHPNGKPGMMVRIEGYYKYLSYRALEEINGQLGKDFRLSDTQQQHFATAWYVKIDNSDRLLSGYSGAPVYDAESGVVLAVAITRDGDQQGRVLSIDALPLIWPEMPPLLLSSNKDTSKRTLHVADQPELLTALVTPPSAVLLKNQREVTIEIMAHGEAESHCSADYSLPWQSFYKAKTPTPEIWQQNLLPQLRAIKADCKRRGITTLLVDSDARLSAGLVFGYVFRESAGFRLKVRQREMIWSTEEFAAVALPLTGPEFALVDSAGTDVSIEVSSARNNIHENVGSYLRQQSLPITKRVFYRITAERINGAQARGITQKIVESIRNERRSGVPAATIHLFGALPLGLVVLIGWELNTLTPIQFHELVDSTYQLSCRLE